MEQIIQQSKDYQLQRCIDTFTDFRKDCYDNTSEMILMTAIDLATKELANRKRVANNSTSFA